MNRTRALELLCQSKPILAARCAVTQLALFGSTARDSAGVDSDLAVLVALSRVLN